VKAINFGEALHKKAMANPDAPAITDATGTLSRQEADTLSDRAAFILRAAGVIPGTIVGITGNNSSKLLAAIFGIWKAGGVPLHIPTSKSTEEKRRLIELAAPRVVVGFGAEVRCEAVNLALDQLWAGTGDSPSWYETPPNLRIGPSGGSTGAAKLIVVEMPAIIDPDLPWPRGMKPDGVHVLPLNLMDGTGFVMATVGLATGSHIVVMERFDPRDTLRLIDAHSSDWMAITPPLMLQLWKLPVRERAQYSLSHLTIGQYSGGAPSWLKQAWISWLGSERVVETYGATDSNGSCTIDGTEWLLHPGSVGRAQNSSEIAILDNDNRHVPPDTVGRIFMRNASGKVRFSYLGAEAEILPGGWSTFGDLGYLDREGYLYFCDRLKDVIHTPSGIVFPLEIEGLLERHEKIRSAVVIGLPDSAGQERVHAIVDTDGQAIDVHELKRSLQSELHAYKVPSTFEVCGEPLRDTAGKARRLFMRSERIAQA
jgi:bile acid-coenzyme A ligase